MSNGDRTTAGATPPPLPGTGPTGPHVPGTLDSRPPAAPGQSYKGLATGSMVCALVGILVAPPILGIIAIILGAVARNNMRISNNPDGRGMATAGLIIGALETAITVVIIIVAIILAFNSGG
jgi:hypothetical protein